MKIHLVLAAVFIALAFDANYVEAIHCYVCNSYYHKGCDDVVVDKKYLKNCDDVEAERYRIQSKALDDMQKLMPKPSDHPYLHGTDDTFVNRSISSYRAGQCVKMVMEIEDSNETDRVYRDCTGLVCKTREKCYRGYSGSQVKSTTCFCKNDGCNAGHRLSLSNSFYLNFLIPILISLNFVLN